MGELLTAVIVVALLVYLGATSQREAWPRRYPKQQPCKPREWIDKYGPFSCEGSKPPRPRS